jgi:UDP-N-acetyl-D-mannosaminuronic acid dehydrogenase
VPEVSQTATVAERHSPQIVVVGCGGVGLPLAVALASRGAEVLGYDIDGKRIEQLASGQVDMLDEGLAGALRATLAAAKIRFVNRLEPMEIGRSFIVAAPTPIDGHRRLDETPIQLAMKTIQQTARAGDLVMIRSTTPVGLTRRLAHMEKVRLLFASCPDRTLAGRAFVEQFTIPHLVGGLNEAAGDAACRTLAILGEVRRVASPEIAEAAKLFSNVWRDARFALANGFALYCERTGLDYAEVRAAASAGSPRFDAPRAGPVGGPCLSKDVHLLADRSSDDLRLFLEARRFNETLVDHIAQRIRHELAIRPKPASVAVLGLAFKGQPETRDRRGSFGEALARVLRTDLTVGTWDPAGENLRAAKRVLSGARVVVLANDHPAFRSHALYDACAENAFIYDLCGVLREVDPLRSDLVVHQLGQHSSRDSPDHSTNPPHSRRGLSGGVGEQA